MLPGRVLFCVAVALVGCNAKTARQPASTGGAGAAAEPSAGEGGGGGSHSAGGASKSCGDCPAAEFVERCCEEYCGYLDVESGHCEPSKAGSRVLEIVAARSGELCPARTDCESEPECPTAQPEEGAACAGTATCTYCAAPSIPRAVGCREGAWKTLGPNAPCGYTVEP